MGDGVSELVNERKDYVVREDVHKKKDAVLAPWLKLLSLKYDGSGSLTVNSVLQYSR